MSLPSVNILDACHDHTLFARWFRDEATWRAWFVFLKALFGLPMDEEGLAIFRACTGLDEPPAVAPKEAWLICGRRAGKSRMLGLAAVFLACFIDWTPFLSPGERGTIMVVAADRRQARTIFRYIMAFLTEVPLLKTLVERDTADLVDLNNGVTIEILTASFRTVRGYTLVAALLDEIAYWRSDADSAIPDEEILTAIRPAMATIPGALLLAASSPYARRGVMWKTYRRNYGKPGPVLVWKSDTRTMNPTVPQAVIDEAYEEDPAAAAAEYGAEFRADVETFVSREVVDTAVVPGRYELPPMQGVTYHAFVDPSGGSSDSMTLAIAHRDRDDRGILDAVREVKPPFSPDSVVEEFCDLIKAYGLHSVTGDRYGGEWPRERFQVHGITYEPAEKPKSDIYRELLPLLNAARVELLDLPRLVAQLCGLERRTARGGRDSIDHAAGGGAHDDCINSAAGALVKAAGKMDGLDVFIRLARGGDVQPPSPEILTQREETDRIVAANRAARLHEAAVREGRL